MNFSLKTLFIHKTTCNNNQTCKLKINTMRIWISFGRNSTLNSLFYYYFEASILYGSEVEILKCQYYILKHQYYMDQVKNKRCCVIVLYGYGSVRFGLDNCGY